ncbi:MAG: deoxyhypusine synthase [Candidatus Diapherotrites archaeon]|uniref:Deoxyhypusine synthase n=1 Tax=Candidatus Iainarchaeum sp. TaxID=3101447 RepID=A0A8T3YKA8_9ARCH|nr:deoxyhypusine synthase [Candidatus Diapherotrites archaeon]
MAKESRESVARRNILRESGDVKGTAIRGYDFDKGVDYHGIVKSFASTGYQASHLSRAIEITGRMISAKAAIFLGYTSNMVSSGLREVFRYLVQHRKVHVVVTTAGGIEEDIIKCLGDFVLGDFRASGKVLRKNGINRIGNIYVPNSRYVRFEEFLQPLLEELYAEQKKTGRAISVSGLVWRMGERINDERSICHWAWKNRIRVFCPALTDGALGDNIYFFKYRRPDFAIDITEDTRLLNDTTIDQGKTGLIILGAGVVKHAILNANMFRNGADFAVYINNSQEFDGSDAGALPEEAVSWGKILPEAASVKVFGDATILFPILVAETFARK